MTKMLPFVLVAAVWAQAPPQNQPEVSSHEAPITFSSRVNLISVPVGVRDKDGRAVGSLKKEDFQVFDKGTLQTITKFSIDKSTSLAEISNEPANALREKAPVPIAPPATLPERYVAYLVDDVPLEPGDLLNARRAMHRHLDESLEATSRAVG